MTLIRYDGPRGTRWGFRFWHRGTLHKRMVGATRAMAVEAEKRERRRLDAAAFEAAWGPFRPKLTSWKEAVERYVTAKAEKASLSVDQQRLKWWGVFFTDQRIHYLQEIAPDVIDRGKLALTKQGMSPATVRGYLAALRGLLQLAVRRWGLIQRNPTHAVDWPTVRPREIRIPTPAERDALLSKADPTLRILILTALYTGLRKSSIIRLEAKDCQVRPGWLRSVQKGNRETWVPIAQEFQAALAPMILRGGRLFRGPGDRPLTRWPEERWRILRRAAGMPWLRVHDLRHTVGTLLGDAGVPQRIIQEYLGHATIQMSQRYTHPMREGMEEAARKLASAVSQKAAKKNR